MTKDSRIFVAGHRGLVGSAVLRKLQAEGYTNLLTRTRAELDLAEQAPVRKFFDQEKPEYIFLCAAKVGGILENYNHPVSAIRDNLLIQTNILDAAHRTGAKKLLFLGSSCIYPRLAPQPMKEEHLLTGPLEPTNEWYAIAKIAGIKMAQALRREYNFNAISLMPTNLYGPEDNFDYQSSHAVPALIRKFHDAKMKRSPAVTVWGTGAPRREFLYVDDLADACLFLMLNYDSGDIINVGVGEDLTIDELARAIRGVVGYNGEIVYDRSKPDGTPRKLLDISRLTALGWRPKTSLSEGLERTYAWFRANLSSIQKA